MKVILDRKGDEVTITEDIVKAAFGNQRSGVEIMKIVLGWKGPQLIITDDHSEFGI
ncbi:DNA-directed DNA polymerase [Purpureocillium takamizusanense]|uniref:DNA-directed DNA polymerase n=1 Tax=Purpureocillium takamizusanense TaxID=2060973 RepID=A0A9Q8QDA4_9HYPO|nr:DNA-directed DNA polymerase [Purpureocillium takamizusanense]UNI17157.1 DNA-directed DNA polymerase [Purpureocillium takamizusanense]